MINNQIIESRTDFTITGILEYIQNNNLKAGDMLPSEVELSASLNTSRTILREAIAYLKGLGVLTSRRGSGYQVQKVDPVSVFNKILQILTLIYSADIAELRDLRRILELGSIETSVINADDGDIERIEQITDKMKDCCRRKGVTYGMYNTLEIDFHTAIMAPSGNRMLSSLNTAIRVYFDREKGEDRNSIFPPEDLRRDTKEHILIASAFAAGNPEAAYTALRSHEHLHQKI